MSEEELQRYVSLLQQYQVQADYLQQQLSMLQLSVEGIDDAIAALDALGSGDRNREVLVPLGAGTFVFSSVADTDRVLLGVGAGVVMEKDREASMASLRSRKEELEGFMKRGTETYAKVAEQMDELQARVQQMLPREA